MNWRAWLCRWLRCSGPPRGRLQWAVGRAQPKGPSSSRMLEVTITKKEKITVTLTPTDQDGEPVAVDGKPVWTITNGDSKILVADDGLSALLISADAPGVTDYLVEADADLGEGIERISDTIKLTVEDPKAVSLGLSAGTAVKK